MKSSNLYKHAFQNVVTMKKKVLSNKMLTGIVFYDKFLWN